MKVHFVLALFLAQTIAAAAQPAAQPAEEVMVFAPFVIKDTTSGPLHARVRTITVSRTVSYQDLDLTKDDEVAKLESRIRTAAKDVCMQLRGRYPGSTVDNYLECKRNATADALMEVDLIVDTIRG